MIGCTLCSRKPVDWTAYQQLLQTETPTPPPPAYFMSNISNPQVSWRRTSFKDLLAIFAMNTPPPLDEFRLEDARKPYIGFRVVVSGGQGYCRNTLEPRYPLADATSLTLQNHLAWKKTPSPFVSLWTSWARAVQWAEGRRRFGAINIDIVAVWIYDRVVYDAYKAAKVLPLPGKKLDYYKNEVIIIGIGGEDDYSILARFYWVTQRKWETVAFFLDPIPSLTNLPVGSLGFAFGTEEDEFERKESYRWQRDPYMYLMHEVYSRTGSYDKIKVYYLALLLCGKQPPEPVVLPLARRRATASEELNARFAELCL